MSLKEDTVSADRKERIIFDPEAWKNKDKSGRKTSAITSRQNFDNEKFTRKAQDKDQVDEGTIQPSGDSKVDSASPTQGDSISDTKVKKSNNPQIEFVTGTANPNGSSSTAIGGAQATGRKIAEDLVKKARAKVKASKGCNEETVLEGNGYDDNRTGFAKKPREDDEYHNEPKPKFKAKSTMDRPHTVHIGGKPWKKFSNGHQAHAAAKTLQAKGKDAHAIAHFNENLTQEETNMSDKLTYAQFVEQLLEYTPGPGGRTVVKGRSYGASYDAGEDEDDKPAKPAADAPKRGRGRPAGSKSGANQKVTTGKSYGGIATHSLNLPNSNR